MVQVPLKIPKAQRTPGECKWEERSLPSNMKANPLSFPPVSSANHTASLKLSLIPSLSQNWFLKVSYIGRLSKAKAMMLYCTCELGGARTAGKHLMIKCIWQMKNTHHLQALHWQWGSIYTISSVPSREACETAGRTGWPSCPWEMEMSRLHGDRTRHYHSMQCLA